MRRCRDPGVVSTEGEENETEPPNISPHLFWGMMGRAVDWIVAVRWHASSRIQLMSRMLRSEEYLLRVSGDLEGDGRE